MPPRLRVQQDAEDQRLQVVRRERSPARFQAQLMRTGAAVVHQVQPLPSDLHEVYRAVGDGPHPVHAPTQRSLRGGALSGRLRGVRDGERDDDTAEEEQSALPAEIPVRTFDKARYLGTHSMSSLLAYPQSHHHHTKKSCQFSSTHTNACSHGGQSKHNCVKNFI